MEEKYQCPRGKDVRIEHYNYIVTKRSKTILDYWVLICTNPNAPTQEIEMSEGDIEKYLAEKNARQAISRSNSIPGRLCFVR